MTTPAYNPADRKRLARTFDEAAARAESMGGNPASPKQIWYLAGLWLESGGDPDEFLLDTSMMLTKREASEMIDYCLRSREIRAEAAS